MTNLSLYIEDPTQGGIMFIGYAFEMHVQASHTIRQNYYDMYPVTWTAAMVCGSFIRKMRHSGEPHPFALTCEQ